MVSFNPLPFISITYSCLGQRQMENALNRLVSDPGYEGGAFIGPVFVPLRQESLCHAKLCMEKTMAVLSLTVGNFLPIVVSVVSFQFSYLTLFSNLP